jgi:SAM-dependent methyltransferase
MTSTGYPHDNYNVAQNASYEVFENALGLPTNDIAYKVAGILAFENTIKTFSDLDLRVGDVGCFTGGTTARWMQLGKTHAEGRRVQVLGTDIHQGNVDLAAQEYQHLTGVQFRFMDTGNEIPRIDDRLYHLLLATFVLDTIPSFADVMILCRNMVAALEVGGTLYLLRLHPVAIKSGITFGEYHIHPREKWVHGDPLTIELTNQKQRTITINDSFWEPERIAEVLSNLGCVVQLMDLGLDPESLVHEHLCREVAAVGLSLDLPEWSVPLYQLICAKRV